jgi:hypothetical protein
MRARTRNTTCSTAAAPSEEVFVRRAAIASYIMSLLALACVEQTGLADRATTVVDRGLVVVRSVAVTPTGDVHVSYLIVTDGNPSHTQIRYATCNRTCGLFGRWERGVLDVGRLAAGPDGAVHAARAGAAGGFVYSRCLSRCTVHSSWDSVVVDGGVDTGSIAGFTADAAGRLHVLYRSGTSTKYATCASRCTSLPGWTEGVAPDSMRPAVAGALVAGAQGDLHIAYLNPDSATLADTIAAEFPMEIMYGACLGGCTAASNWQLVSLGKASVPLGDAVRQTPALAIDGSGRLHLAFASGSLFQPRISYATCAASCGSNAAWVVVVADSGSHFGNVALAASPAGPIAMSYASGVGAILRYATCNGACSDTSHWAREPLPGSFVLDVHLGFDRSGDPHIVFDDFNGNLRYSH